MCRLVYWTPAKTPQSQLCSFTGSKLITLWHSRTGWYFCFTMWVSLSVSLPQICIGGSQHRHLPNWSVRPFTCVSACVHTCSIKGRLQVRWENRLLSYFATRGSLCTAPSWCSRILVILMLHRYNKSLCLVSVFFPQTRLAEITPRILAYIRPRHWSTTQEWWFDRFGEPLSGRCLQKTGENDYRSCSPQFGAFLNVAIPASAGTPPWVKDTFYRCTAS